MRLDPVKWLIGAWRDPMTRFYVMGEYRALAGQKYLMMDIARRGGVYAAQRPTNGDAFENGRQEGRREFALELLELARADTNALSADIARITAREERTR